MLFILYDKYENDIFMKILRVRVKSNYVKICDKFGKNTEYVKSKELMHVHIKYDHGHLDYSITPAPPPPQHTKPAPRDAVIDDAVIEGAE
jgi:hypothetical protein